MYVCTNLHISISLSLSLCESVFRSSQHEPRLGRCEAMGCGKAIPQSSSFLMGGMVTVPFPTGCFVPRFYSEIRDGL